MFIFSYLYLLCRPFLFVLDALLSSQKGREIHVCKCNCYISISEGTLCIMLATHVLRMYFKLLSPV